MWRGFVKNVSLYIFDQSSKEYICIRLLVLFIYYSRNQWNYDIFAKNSFNIDHVPEKNYIHRVCSFPFNMIFIFTKLSSRLQCCEVENTFDDDCWDCRSDRAPQSKGLCDLNCVYSNDRTVSEEKLKCHCNDIFYGDCCEKGVHY